MNEAAKPGSKRSRPAESAKPCAWRASVESKFKLAPAIALSYVAHGQAWSRRIMVSVWVRALTRDCRSALRRVKSNERGDACSIRFDGKLKQCFDFEPASLTAKKLRKPRASTTPSSKLNNNSSSER